MSWNAAGEDGEGREDKETAEGGFQRVLCLFREQEEVREHCWAECPTAGQ